MRVGVCAALLVCVLTGGGAVAAQTAVTPQAQVPPQPSSSGAARVRWVARFRAKTGERRSPPVIAVPLATDGLGLPKGWSFRFESPATWTTVSTARVSAAVAHQWNTGLAGWRWHVGVGLTGNAERGCRCS